MPLASAADLLDDHLTPFTAGTGDGRTTRLVAAPCAQGVAQLQETPLSDVRDEGEDGKPA